MNTTLAPYRPDHDATHPTPAPAPAYPAPALSIDEVWQIAVSVAKSGLFPGAKTPEQAFTLMLLCQSEGLHAIQAVRRFDVIDGKPALKAAAVQAEFQARGGEIEILRTDAQEARAVFRHPTHQPKGVEMAVTWDQYHKIGLTSKAVWKNYPDAMLWWRLVMVGVRRVYPGIVVGIYSAEEVEDMAALRGPTPRALPEPAPEPALPAGRAKAELGQWVTGLAEQANADWLARWTGAGGEVDPRHTPLVDRKALALHLAAWAKAHGHASGADAWARGRDAITEEGRGHVARLWEEAEAGLAPPAEAGDDGDPDVDYPDEPGMEG